MITKAAKWAILAALPGTVQAFSACDAILQLDDLTAAMERITVPGHRQIPADMGQIRQISRTAQADSILFALQDHPVATHAQTIDALFFEANGISQTYATGQIDDAVAQARSPTTRTTVTRSRAALAPYPCTQTIRETPSSGQRTSALTRNGPTTIGLPRAQALSFVAAAGVLIFGGAWLLRHHLARLAHRRRQEKRHYLSMPAILRDAKGTRPITVEVLDISGHGAKIRLAKRITLTTGAEITLRFSVSEHWAIVRWSNPFFAGLQFKHPMPLADVNTLALAFKPGSRQATRPQEPAAQTH